MPAKMYQSIIFVSGSNPELDRYCYLRLISKSIGARYMLNIIFLLIAGSGLMYISKYNLGLVSVNMGFYTIADVPLFFVIVASLLVGFILSYIAQLIINISTYIEIKSKSKEIKTGQEEILDLTKTVHQLELANEKLKHSGPETSDSNAL